MSPWKQNCTHSNNGWCLRCVSRLGDAIEEYRNNDGSRVWYDERRLREAGRELDAALTVGPRLKPFGPSMVCVFCKGSGIIGKGVVNRIMRRADEYQNTPAEKAISDAIRAVETVGADPVLTDAVTLLTQAKDKVGDYEDAKPKPPAEIYVDSNLVGISGFTKYIRADLAL